MRRGAETFEAICQSLTQNPKFSVACRVVGISEKTLYQWLGKSQQGDPEFIFDYLDPQTPLHVAVKQAQQIFYHSVIQTTEHEALHGVWKQTYYKGQPCYRLDPKLLSWTDEQLQQLGMDRYLRDENGEMLPVTEWHPPSAQIRLAVLAARAPKAYATKIQHEVSSRVSLGVHVVPQKPIAPPMPVTVVAPSLPAPEPDAEDGDFVDALGDMGLGLDPEPEVEAPSDVEPEDSEPEAPTGNPAVSHEPSPLRRELELLLAARSKGAPAESSAPAPAPASATAYPPPPIHRNTTGSADQDRVGTGTEFWENGRPPGAIKLA